MARLATESLITQSVLDRLTNVDDWPATRSQSLRYFKDALKRDLEWLLNTRRPPIPELAEYDAAKNSVINYGLPDITSLGLSSASDHRRLRIAIEESIRNFEPRLADVRVSLDGAETANRRLRFHIEGSMKLDPSPEEISFDTVLELSSGEYKVK
ncbi:type VI secretion system baseplate subunit TssE [Paracidobacterium acidisoli]|uniref:Type VI secretion system baseplate subunit TssE n=1 Tax=Paracidobacterium acidisoli TaxID=2303751 RepID=A0A372IR32_9BACT|nr:type VI secretion system baseplate subunit TssE [Paracidobacterium acidisoli]MBT9330203.1 type VI secretion system baseplate subunit TssE [Paracidobacterium acidisoli]